MSPDPATWIRNLRFSHERLAALVAAMDVTELEGPSYCAGWSVAQVLSHLGSQAEIFSSLLEAGLRRERGPGEREFSAVWEAWDARGPADKAADSIAANAALVRSLENLGPSDSGRFHLEAFGRELDLTSFMRLRLSEHAVHTWDVAVPADPEATVAAEAVMLLLPSLPEMAARVGKPSDRPLAVETLVHEPERHFVLDAAGVRLEPWDRRPIAGLLELRGEALLRLVYGRLDREHQDAARLVGPAVRLDDLRTVFRGF